MVSRAIYTTRSLHHSDIMYVYSPDNSIVDQVPVGASRKSCYDLAGGKLCSW